MMSTFALVFVRRVVVQVLVYEALHVHAAAREHALEVD